MQAYESKMKRAADKKLAKQKVMQQSAHSLSSKVDDKMILRQQKEQDVFMEEFRRNILKRTEMEKRKKKRAEENMADMEYNMQ